MMVLLRLLAVLLVGVAGVLGLAGACGGSEFTSDGAGGSGGDPSGSGGSADCSAPADCPGQDLSCVKRSCEAGTCGLMNVAVGEATAEQYVGDCKTVRCNGQGATVSEPDADDAFDDGNECTDDICEAGVPSNPPRPRAPCALTSGGQGICGADAVCVECIGDGDCGGEVCLANQCVPASCKNEVVDGGETDLNCGGLECPPCADLEICVEDSDCLSEVCVGSICQVPSCDDDVANGEETGEDCGGESSGCPPCPAGQPCGAPSDCKSQVCVGGGCKAPTCLDGVKNGNETDQDCGGPDCSSCPLGETCTGDGDCQSGYCGAAAVCADRCMNMVRDGGESDVDCGGPSCTQCGLNARCLCNDDCKSQVCCVDLSGGVEAEGTCVADIGSCDGSPVNLCSIN